MLIFILFSDSKDKYSTNLTINDKSIDGVLGGGRMEGADESTELWRHPLNVVLYIDLTNQANEKAKS